VTPAKFALQSSSLKILPTQPFEFSPNGTQLAIRLFDKNEEVVVSCIWDMRQDAIVSSTADLNQISFDVSPRNIHWSADRIAAVGIMEPDDYESVVVRMTAGSSALMAGPECDPNAIEFSQDGKTVFIADWDRLIRWRVGSTWKEAPVDCLHCRSIALSPSGETIAVRNGASIVLCDAETLDVTKTFYLDGYENYDTTWSRQSFAPFIAFAVWCLIVIVYALVRFVKLIIFMWKATLAEIASNDRDDPS